MGLLPPTAGFVLPLGASPPSMEMSMMCGRWHHGFLPSCSAFIRQFFCLAHLILLLLFYSWSLVIGDPQTKLLNRGCSQYNATNTAVFFANLNVTFSDLRAQLGPSPHFATAQSLRASDPVYALFQCRDYLSPADCAACLAAAEALIRTCAAANGARVIFDGCFLRYESAGFFDQTTLPGNVGICGNRTARAPGFESAAEGLLADLAAATPRVNGFFAAAERGGPGAGVVVYGVAQCVRTVSATGCGDCLRVAYDNVKGCPPAADARAVDAGCFMRYSDSAFFPANQTMNLAPFLASGSSSSSSNNAAIAGGVAGAVTGLLLLLAVGTFLWCRRSRREQRRGRSGDISGTTELRGPMKFHFKDLKTATRSFSEENKLGEGGFGDVYKGILKNGIIVAVKKLAISTNRVKQDFQSEVKLVSNVHHRNLVRLIGCSSKGPELLLVYEYMVNSSLDKFLFGERRGILNWQQRFHIIVGMARGLAYLHDEFHVRIIHRDIKSSNILLDDNFQPKIADFGLARLFPEDQSHLSTRFAGTLGYTAPEYAIHGQLSEKVDTYSYGVVVLEIISGRKCNDMKLEPITQYLLEWAWKLYEEGMLLNLVDNTLNPNEFKAEEVTKVIEIALSCTQSVAASRPTMSEVVVLLLSKARTELHPTRPTFIDATSRIRGEASTPSVSSSASNATVSISQFSAR